MNYFWLLIPDAVLVCKARRPAVFDDLLFLHRKLPQRDVFPVLFSLLSLFLSKLDESAGRGRSVSCLVSSGEFVIAFLFVSNTCECSIVVGTVRKSSSSSPSLLRCCISSSDIVRSALCCGCRRKFSVPAPLSKNVVLSRPL